jgi:small basic protein (TIGR04137 family)
MVCSQPIQPELLTVSIDQSLKKPRGLVRARNVLKRGERIDQLIEEGRWQEGRSALGLPKVLVQKAVGGKKKKKEKDEEDGESATSDT